MQKHHFLLLVYTLPIWLAGVVVYLLHALNPVKSGPWGIILVFLTVYLLVASVFFTVLHLGLKVYSRIATKRSVSAKKYRIGVRKAYYIASTLAFGPVMLLALQSVRQLTITDVLLVIMFLALGCFYVIKKRP